MRQIEDKVDGIDKKNNEFQTKILQSMFQILQRLQVVEEKMDELKKKKYKMDKAVFNQMLMNQMQGEDDDEEEEEEEDEKQS